MLLAGLRAHEHLHAAPFQLGGLIHHRYLGQYLGKPLFHLEAQVGMGHLAPAEPDGYLELVAGLYKLGRLADLGVEVVRVDVQRKPDLLDVDDLLILLGFLVFLLLFKAELAVVHQLAHRRGRLRCDLDQVQLLLLRHAQRVAGGHDAQLAAVSADQSDLSVANAFIQLQVFFAVRSDWDTPPSKTFSFEKTNAATVRQPRSAKHTQRRPKAGGLSV